MIGFLRGTVTLQNDPYVFIDVQGVGYKVLVARDVLQKISPDEMTIFTYTYVREDTLELFGFSHQDDLILFEKLISISGIGPKTAVQVFSVGTRAEILQAIAHGNVDFFTTVPRLGKKNAQKLIIELRSKIDAVGNDAIIESDNSDLFDALTRIGFSQKEISTAIQSLDLSGMKSEQKIKAILKHFNK